MNQLAKRKGRGEVADEVAFIQERQTACDVLCPPVFSRGSDRCKSKTENVSVLMIWFDLHKFKWERRFLRVEPEL